MTDAVIEIDNISKKLNEKKFEADQGPSPCLFNLIVYTHEKFRTDYFQNLTKTIAAQFPCRVITIIANVTTHESYLKVKASKEVVTKGSAKMTYDSITIESSGSEVDRIPFIVIPNLVPDLSVYLVWGQDPTSGNDLLGILKKYVSRLIIDSQCTSNLSKFAQRIYQQIYEDKAEIVDMNWAQIVNWRDIFLQVFDNEEKIKELKRAHKVIFHYFTPHYKNVIGHSLIQAIYLQGWLATQLGWKLDSFKKNDLNYTLSYKFNGHPIELELMVVEEEGYGVKFVEVYTDNQGIYELEFQSKFQRVCVNYSTKERCDLPFNVPFTDGKKGTSLLNEIFFQPLSQQYLNMLNTIKQIEW